VSSSSPEPTPPPGLAAVQRIARETAEWAAGRAEPGMSEIELRDLIEEHARGLGAVDFWSITNVGFGSRSTICFPDQPPIENRLGATDVGHVDVHPIDAGGYWGDCTRTFTRGRNEEHQQAFAAVRGIHEQTLASCRPGMRAQELFAPCLQAIEQAGYRLLDPWSNIGHSLRRGSAYDEKFIDAGNERQMWGAWAVEPFLGTDAFGVKLEDVVWFGGDRCVVLR
jgi:Xaa-Pro aminopeptidase